MSIIIGKDWSLLDFVLPVRFWSDYSEKLEKKLIVVRENWNREADVRYRIRYDFWQS